jgi:hypothetical protein
MRLSMSDHSIERALSFLALQQDEDGFWRDYCLVPGRAEAWTTACVGFALVQNHGPWSAIVRAAEALQAVRRPAGWGYNRATACDADTTSWVIRFLAAIDALDRGDAARLLAPHVSASGRVRTFKHVERFGRWADEHDEVAPLAGMALLEAGDSGLAALIRQSVLAAPTWKPFWWHCPAYVCAKNLEFLSLCGGIPINVGNRASAVLDALPSPSSALDTAQRLATEAILAKRTQNEAPLIDLQHADGGWPPSFELLVPSQDSARFYRPVAV